MITVILFVLMIYGLCTVINVHCCLKGEQRGGAIAMFFKLHLYVFPSISVSISGYEVHHIY